MASLAKRRGGCNRCGPLGAGLKQNSRYCWWNDLVRPDVRS